MILLLFGFNNSSVKNLLLVRDFIMSLLKELKRIKDKLKIYLLSEFIVLKNLKFTPNFTFKRLFLF
jgi:hypothetical protein